MLITECGTADRVRAESENDLNLIGTCVMCRYMKMTQLEDILQALRDPYPEQIIELNEESYSVLREVWTKCSGLQSDSIFSTKIKSG